MKWNKALFAINPFRVWEVVSQGCVYSKTAKFSLLEPISGSPKNSLMGLVFDVLL